MQKVGVIAHRAADVALAVIGPVTFERMVQPLGPQRRIVGDEQQHRLLQPLAVVTPRAEEALPVLEEGIGV